MSFINQYESNVSEIYLFPALTNSINTVTTNFGGAVSAFDIETLFAYSIDGNTWSEYYDNTVFNTVISNLSYQKAFIKVWVKVKPLDNNYNTVKFLSFLVDGKPLEPCGVEYPPKEVVVSSCLDANLMRYHDDLSYMQNIRKQLNHAMSNNMGFDAKYFRTNNSGVNHTFKVYTIHNVVEVADIKIIMDEANTPTNELTFEEYLLYYGGAIKVWIDQIEWDKNFTDHPTPKDSLYIPFFNKRMTVSKVRIDREFADESVGYELSLIKYVEDATVNKEYADGLLDNFADFVNGAGLMQDTEETKEYIKASTTDSSVQDTEINKDIVNHNMHSLLTYRIKPLYAHRNTITHKGVLGLDWMYLSPEIESEALMLQYDVSEFDTDKYSLSFWTSFSSVEDRVVYKTYRGGDIAHVFSLKANGAVTLDVFSGQNSINIQTAPVVPIVADSYYNIHINKTQAVLTLTVSIYNETTGALEIIQENVSMNSVSDNPIDQLEFFCNENPMKLGMIKMNESTVQKADLEKHLFPQNHFDTIFTDRSHISTTTTGNGGSLNDGKGISDDFGQDC